MALAALQDSGTTVMADQTATAGEIDPRGGKRAVNCSLVNQAIESFSPGSANIFPAFIAVHPEEFFLLRRGGSGGISCLTHRCHGGW